jgi:predicted O-methyltransferase YrrM
MKIYVYGTGDSCERFLRGIKNDIEVIAFVDRKEKIGDNFHGKKIIGIDDIGDNFDYIVIASQFIEIYYNLIKIIDGEKVILFEEKAFKDIFLGKDYITKSEKRIKIIESMYIGENFAINLFEPGHFYSPIPNLIEIKDREKDIFDNIINESSGINLNEKEQLNLIKEFEKYYNELPFPDEKENNFRYYYKNDFYSYSDAITLYSMIRHYKPKKIIEVGSGYSSALMLDTNEKFFGNNIKLNFIEPHTERLQTLIKENDNCTIINENLQNVDIKYFEQLEKDDILFIDSSHISKIGSDVNYIIFDILPSLNKGVKIHFHDITYPFEYSKESVYKGISWNEIYLVRAFLQYNSSFRIKYWNQFLTSFYSEEIYKRLPLCMKNAGGSLWIEKI